MYDKILLAVDHSEISDKAVSAARDLALLSKGEVWVLHLREREIAARTAMVIADETVDEAKASVDAIVEKLIAAGVKAHGEIRNTLFGYAGREIVDEQSIELRKHFAGGAACFGECAQNASGGGHQESSGGALSGYVG